MKKAVELIKELIAFNGPECDGRCFYVSAHHQICRLFLRHVPNDIRCDECCDLFKKDVETD